MYIASLIIPTHNSGKVLNLACEPTEYINLDFHITQNQ